MDEMHEVSLRVHHLVMLTVMTVAETVRAGTGCKEMILAEGLELDEYRQVIIRAAMIESCLRLEVSMQRTPVEALVRRVQGAGDLPAGDCVLAAMFPLGNVVSMGDDGRALVQPHPDNQVVIQYPRCYNLLAMGPTGRRCCNGLLRWPTSEAWRQQRWRTPCRYPRGLLLTTRRT